MLLVTRSTGTMHISTKTHLASVTIPIHIHISDPDRHQNLIITLQCPWERLRSILMSMSVGLWVCLSARISPESGTTCAIFTKFFVHVACVHGSVLFRHVYDRPHCVSPGRAFLPHWQCIYLRNRTRSFCQIFYTLPTSVARSSSDLFTISRIVYFREGVFFPIENALSAGKGDGSAQSGRSMLSTIALFVHWPISNLSQKFHANPFATFCAQLLTDNQRQNITSLAEVINIIGI